MHQEKKLDLVFEFLDLDLKKCMDSTPQCFKDPATIRVRAPARVLRHAGNVGSSSSAGHAAPHHPALQSFCQQMLQGIAYCHSHRSARCAAATVPLATPCAFPC